jgi:hypothetical protein
MPVTKGVATPFGVTREIEGPRRLLTYRSPGMKAPPLSSVLSSSTSRVGLQAVDFVGLGREGSLHLKNRNKVKGCQWLMGDLRE